MWTFIRMKFQRIAYLSFSDKKIQILLWISIDQSVQYLPKFTSMAGSNPRKFKDRIALMKQRQDESTAQFQASYY